MHRCASSGSSNKRASGFSQEPWLHLQRYPKAAGRRRNRDNHQESIPSKFNHTNSVMDMPRQHRPKLLDRRHYDFIDNALISNDELTTRQLHTLLIQQFPDVKLSHSTLKRAKYELGWVITNPKCCQLNKEKRLAWCKKMIEDGEQFEDVLFTDASSVMLETHRKKCYRKRCAPRKLNLRPKHPIKVHVWGGISKHGATSVVIFTGIMTAIRYTKSLEAALLLFAQEIFPCGYRFQQDNDPKHCAHFTRNYFSAHNVNWWRTPAESPDLNPIENVWGSMKEYLCNTHKPKGLEGLKKGIREFWNTLTPSVCTNYINHIHRVMPVVTLHRLVPALRHCVVPLLCLFRVGHHGGDCLPVRFTSSCADSSRYNDAVFSPMLSYAAKGGLSGVHLYLGKEGYSPRGEGGGGGRISPKVAQYPLPP